MAQLPGARVLEIDCTEYPCITSVLLPGAPTGSYDTDHPQDLVGAIAEQIGPRVFLPQDAEAARAHQADGRDPFVLLSPTLLSATTTDGDSAYIFTFGHIVSDQSDDVINRARLRVDFVAGKANVRVDASK